MHIRTILRRQYKRQTLISRVFNLIDIKEEEEEEVNVIIIDSADIGIATAENATKVTKAAEVLEADKGTVASVIKVNKLVEVLEVDIGTAKALIKVD